LGAAAPFTAAPFILDAGVGVALDVDGFVVAVCGATPPVEGGATMTATGRKI
jgi:hypothetical protein